ncbi:hypothetical protein ACF0H5_002486 [Mactra antiquata]
MDSKSLAYFSSINPLARKIIKDEKYVKSALKEKWDEFSLIEQEALIDDFIVDNSVRERYSTVTKQHSYQKSFPKLKVETGDKIVVDFENDCWTWQDEHSAPFNWRTKSQQDLTLDDLEPENLYTKPRKEKKSESNGDATVTDDKDEQKEIREFSVVATSIWDSPFLQGMKKPDYLNRSRSTSPTKSSATSRESLLTNRSKTPEEVNYAFSASMEDLSSSPSIPEEINRSLSASSGEMHNEAPSQTDGPTKPPRPRRSYSKSPIKSILSSRPDSEYGSQTLVVHNDDDVNAFDNPVVRNEWGSFVNEKEEAEPASATPSPYKSLLTEPETIDIDRGQEPVMSDTGDEFQDELLFVEKQGTDESDSLNVSTLSKTGFDFLDNW